MNDYNQIRSDYIKYQDKRQQNGQMKQKSFKNLSNLNKNKIIRQNEKFQSLVNIKQNP